MASFKKYLSNLSIYIKLILSFILIMIFFCMIFFINYYYYKNDKLNTTLNTINQMNSQSLSEIDSYINDIKELTKTPLFENNKELIKNLKNSNTNSSIFPSFEDNIDPIFNSIFSLKNDIHSVFLFNLNNQSRYKISGSSLLTNYYPGNESWFKTTVDSFGKPILVPCYKLDYMADKPSGINYFFSISRAIIDYDSSSVVGVITINTNVSILKNFVQKLFLFENQRILLVDTYNNIVYDNEENNISNSLSSINIDLDNNNLSDKNYITINDEKCIVKVTSSLNNELKLINIIPYSSLNKELNTLQNSSLFIILTFITFALILIIVLSKHIVKPIQTLSKKMTLVEQGNLDISINISSTDEVGRLSDSFNTMLSKLKELINEVYVNKIKQKETEIKMLQTQINPHFLYNTLESIHMMAEINDDFEVSKMSTSLGSILRYGLSSNINFVTLEDEINNVNLYIDLQKNRFDNIDDIKVNIPNYLLQANVIKLILQPIVENSVYHGLSTIESNGQILITAYEEDRNLIINIADNGEGIDESNLIKLNAYINGLNNEFSSIGLKNVNMRIQLNYGVNYGVTVFNNSTNGTLVQLKLPLCIG